jgi:tetratricopeptide (TPR) repeat protein/predicted Ser/Thr protein kinase
VSDSESSTNPSDADSPAAGSVSAALGDGELASGAEIGRYVLLRPLASGGMGVVYLAFDPELDRNVALKLVLPRRRARADEPEALVAEARALAKLSHPNVIQVYDVGRWRDRVYVALEYVEGRTLDAWLRATARTPREILEALTDAGRGIAAAHRAQMVHLDIKPSNILMGDDAVVRVVDFGLARAATGTPSADPMTSSSDGAPARVVGTLGYIAPEQFLGHPPDARTDQFSFCVTAWEALTGVRPFAGRTRREYERAVLDEVPSVAEGRPVAPRVLAVLRVGLARRPSARMADMDALLRALTAAASPWTPMRKLALGLGASAIVAAGLAWGTRGSVSPCVDDGDAMADTWNDTRAQAIAEAFDATGLPYAAGAWASARHELDRRVEEWRRTDHENCLATHERGARPVAAYERSRSCLDVRRDEIAALLGLFERADATIAESAASAARALPAPARCLEDTEHIESVLGDPELADDLSRQLAEAWALGEASRFEAAMEVATRVAEEAKRAALPVIEARAYLLGGHAAGRLARAKEAQALLELGVRTADAAGADDERIVGLSDLVYVAGHVGGDPKRAHWFARLARALMERTGERPSRSTILLLNEAVVFADEGRYDESLTTYREALAAWHQGELVIDETLAVLFNNLGSLHLSRGEYGEAAVWFLHGYLLRVSLAGPEHPAVADVLVNWGNVLLHLGEAELALDHNRRALAILENARGRDDPNAGVVLNNIAVILLELGRHAEARTYSQRALELWRGLDSENPMAAVALANLAQGDLSRGDPAAALSGYRRAHAQLTRTLEVGHPYVTNAMSGIGRALLAMDHAADAAVVLRHAVDLADRGGAPGELRAEPRLALARALARRDAAPALVLGLARQARRLYAELGPYRADEVAEIDADLARWQRAWARRAP